MCSCTERVLSKRNRTFRLRLPNIFTLFCSDSDDDEDDDDRDERVDSWRSSGGVFQPLVSVVEPYFISFAELLVNGVLSSLISNFLESTTMIGDGRLV